MPPSVKCKIHSSETTWLSHLFPLSVLRSPVQIWERNFKVFFISSFHSFSCFLFPNPVWFMWLLWRDTLHRKMSPSQSLTFGARLVGAMLHLLRMLSGSPGFHLLGPGASTQLHQPNVLRHCQKSSRGVSREQNFTWLKNHVIKLCRFCHRTYQTLPTAHTWLCWGPEPFRSYTNSNPGVNLPHIMWCF